MLVKSPSVLELLLDELELLVVVLVLLLTEEMLIDLLPMPCGWAWMGTGHATAKTAFNWFNGRVGKLGRYFFRKKCGFICLVLRTGFLIEINTRKLMQGNNCLAFGCWAFFAATIPAGGMKHPPVQIRPCKASLCSKQTQLGEPKVIQRQQDQIAEQGHSEAQFYSLPRCHLCHSHRHRDGGSLIGQ